MSECSDNQPINCSVAKAIRVIGSKWTILILHHLFKGRNRFGELQRALPGISPKTLSQRLKELEKERMITKKVFAEIPLHVEYYPTKKGRSIQEIVRIMEEWGAGS